MVNNKRSEKKEAFKFVAVLFSGIIFISLIKNFLGPVTGDFLPGRLGNELVGEAAMFLLSSSIFLYIWVRFLTKKTFIKGLKHILSN